MGRSSYVRSSSRPLSIAKAPAFAFTLCMRKRGRKGLTRSLRGRGNRRVDPLRRRVVFSRSRSIPIRAGGPMVQSPENVTEMLLDWSRGDEAALERLLPAVYQDLRRHAARHLRRERPDHTLQATALIHEAYLRLVDQRRVEWQNR